MRLFSIRHRQAFTQRRLSISIPNRLRRRLWAILKSYDHGFSIQRNPYNSWSDDTTVLDEVKRELLKTYGEVALVARVNPQNPDDNQRGPVDLKGFLLGGYPAEVLDVIEATWAYFDIDERSAKLEGEVNEAFETENCPWRFSGGVFFKVDSEFFANEVIERTQTLLKAEQFNGAAAEFQDALADLQLGETKDTLVKAAKALESALKTTLSTEKGNASDLIRGFINAGYCDDLPQSFRTPFGESVLMALPFLRNKLGAHGQGAEVIDVPASYAKLAVYMAAGFIQFVVEKHLTKKPGPPNPSGDEVPF